MGSDERGLRGILGSIPVVGFFAMLGSSPIVGCGDLLDDDSGPPPEGEEGEFPGGCDDLGELEVAMRSGSLEDGGRACFGFTVSEIGTLDFAFGGTVSDVYTVQAIPDLDGDRRIDVNEDAFVSVNRVRERSAALEKGDYILAIGGGGATEFTLEAVFTPYAPSAPPIDPGDGPDDSAWDLGALGSVLVGGYIGPLDQTDYYRFEVDQIGLLGFAVEDATSDVLRAGLVVDRNEDGRLTEGELISEMTRARSRSIPLPRGTYHIRMTAGTALYGLSLAHTEHAVASPETDPGSEPDESAHAFGPLTSQRLGGYVGVLDEKDVYTLSVSEPGTLTVAIEDTVVGVINIDVGQDADGDGIADPGETIRARDRTGTLTAPLPEAGEYYIRVFGNETTYTMTADFEPEL